MSLLRNFGSLLSGICLVLVTTAGCGGNPNKDPTGGAGGTTTRTVSTGGGGSGGATTGSGVGSDTGTGGTSSTTSSSTNTSTYNTDLVNWSQAAKVNCIVVGPAQSENGSFVSTKFGLFPATWSVDTFEFSVPVGTSNGQQFVAPPGNSWVVAYPVSEDPGKTDPNATAVPLTVTALKELEFDPPVPGLKLEVYQVKLNPLATPGQDQYLQFQFQNTVYPDGSVTGAIMCAEVGKTSPHPDTNEWIDSAADGGAHHIMAKYGMAFDLDWRVQGFGAQAQDQVLQSPQKLHLIAVVKHAQL